MTALLEKVPGGVVFILPSPNKIHDTHIHCRYLDTGDGWDKATSGRIDVQRIWGKATDEPISTDLDCIKNRLWGVHPEPLLTYGLYTCTSVSQDSTRSMKRTKTRFYKLLSNNNQGNSFSFCLSSTLGQTVSSKSLASKSTTSPSVVSKSFS